ncbi:hypothetical protein IV203_023529 [Nitzschia inconspicua]|uniref:Uncharacterized protein n=1 Tax=Nitzschia inconspicua TaxID=303405 RepID=A0A9K3PCE7_9STRA|nr:hypothetical protein IV203_023529 [Nitzschia inconspicua]
MTAADTASMSSGQTRQTTATALTVRKSNVMRVNQPSATKASDPPLKPPLSSKTKGDSAASSPSSTASKGLVPAEKNSNVAATSSFFVPGAPLPSARQLSKVMCRVVDNDAYTKSDAMVALKRLHDWALKQDVNFGNALVGIGGIQHVLFFIEDHQTDAKTISSALLLLKALTTPVDEYESMAMTNTRQKISQSLVDGQGIELLLKTFQCHAMPERRLSNDPPAGSTAMKELHEGHDSLWNSFSSIWNCENGDIVMDENAHPTASIDYLVMHTCGAFGGTNSAMSDGRSMFSPSREAIDTAILCMNVVSNIIPSSAGLTPDKSSAVLSTLLDAIPLLVASSSNSLPKPEKESLVGSIMACLVSTVNLAQNTILKNSNNNAMSKQVIDVTVKMMREFPHHSQIVCDGCLVLQGVCHHLQKSERKRYGVIAALGAVVASDDVIDKKVKEIADAILEEQFK